MLTAVSILEEFIASGHYQDWKQAEHELTLVKNEFKRFLREDEMRRDFTDIGINLVAKYRRKPVYEVDHEGLNRFLHENYGLLIPASSLNLKKNDQELWERLSKYQFPTKWYVRFTPNKAGRAKKKDVNYSHLDIHELSHIFYDLSKRVEIYNRTYEYIRENFFRDKELQLNRKIQTKYGSVSLQAKQPEFNMYAIFEDYGEDFIIHNARVRMKDLDHFIERGYVRQSELIQFRKMIDIRLEFIVQDVEVEQKQFEMFNSKMHRIAKTLRSIG